MAPSQGIVAAFRGRKLKLGNPVAPKTFEASYEQLEQRLFKQQAAIRDTGERPNRRQRPSSSKASAFSRPAKPNR